MWEGDRHWHYLIASVQECIKCNERRGMGRTTCVHFFQHSSTGRSFLGVPSAEGRPTKANLLEKANSVDIIHFDFCKD